MVRKLWLGSGVLVAVALSVAAAPSGAGHGSHGQGAGPAPERETLQWQIAELRHATARFHRVSVALEEGYAPFGGCFSDPAGGMGFHYANAELIEDPAVDPLHPELLMYERQQDGSLRLIGAEYITFQAAWHGAGNRKLPKLFGQLFHLNTTLLDQPFYLLHVWHWKHNPNGRFADWNPRVGCPAATS
jgi:hypothetical protein